MLFTIGYEKSEFPALARTLLDAGVTRLIDVRASPHSRRREFAYKHLGPGLDPHGLAYESWPELGAPEPAREAAKQGDAATFFRLYEAQLDTGEAQQALEKLGQLAANESPCVMCYERDPKQCHRMLIAERLASMAGVEVEHLFVRS
jgi:uncharacterized protein (DUF488 family)